MTPDEILQELKAFSRRVDASTTAQELDGIISDARAKLASCGQCKHDILTRLSEAVSPPTGDIIRRPFGQEATRPGPTKENEMRFLAFGKLQQLMKQDQGLTVKTGTHSQPM
jgi:hypothetical protein